MMTTAIQRKKDRDQNLVLLQNILLVQNLVGISSNLMKIIDTWMWSNSDTFSFTCSLERSYKKSKKHKKKSKKRRHKSVSKLLIFILGFTLNFLSGSRAFSCLVLCRSIQFRWAPKFRSFKVDLHLP